MKGKCKYCGIKLEDEANIRCYKCDVIWQDGCCAGEQNIKSKLQELFRALRNLALVD
jgi:primosomal protein N'